MKKKKGFTLIELLAVIVVLGLTFLFVGPKLISLIKDGEDKETKLIEERVLSAAKDYVNDLDSSFYKGLYKEGDTGYIYKTDLLKNGLITEEEVSKLDTFSGVKGELVADDKIEYTIEYIDADPSEYTNEELYTMFQSLNDRINNGGTGGSIDSSVIDDLQSQINENKQAISNIDVGEGVDGTAIQNLQTQITANTTLINQYSTNVSNLTNKDNANNVFLKTYPVGSIYVSTSITNPGTVFGGTWVSFGSGRTLVGVDSSQTEFAGVEKTGGAKTHTLTVEEMPSHKHELIRPKWFLADGDDVATTIYGTESSTGLGVTSGTTRLYKTIIDYNSGSRAGILLTGGSQAHNNLQPYITVYMWKRTA